MNGVICSFIELPLMVVVVFVKANVNEILMLLLQVYVR